MQVQFIRPIRGISSTRATKLIWALHSSRKPSGVDGTDILMHTSFGSRSGNMLVRSSAFTPIRSVSSAGSSAFTPIRSVSTAGNSDVLADVSTAREKSVKSTARVNTPEKSDNSNASAAREKTATWEKTAFSAASDKPRFHFWASLAVLYVSSII
jgi:hypothetical protein